MKLTPFTYRMDVANPSASRSLPRDVPGLVQELDADVGVTYTLGLVLSSWADQSGNGYTATPLAGSLGLTGLLEDKFFANHASITLNGVNDSLIADALASTFSGTTKPFYIVQVIRDITLPTNGSFWCFGRSSSGTPFDYFRTVGAAPYRHQRRNDAGSLVAGDGGTPNTTQSHITEVTWDGSNTSVWIDGTLIVNNVALAGGAMTVDRFTIGSARTNAGGSQFGNFALTRHLIYSAIPSTADQTWLRQYLKTRYETP